MIRKSSRGATMVALGITAILATGCAEWRLPALKLPKPPGAPDIHPIRKERAEVALSSFDKQRNRAQYEAAATAWRQGDFTSARDSLEKVLFRDPEHRESLLLLADLELEQDQSAEAVEVLRKAVAAHPQDAEIAYKLALALEVDHQSSEALHFFRTAMQLDPTEQKYADAFALAQSETVVATDEEPVMIQPDAPAAAEESEIITVSASEEKPQPRDAELEAVLELREAGRQGEFLPALKKLLGRDPKHVEASILQAEVDIESGRTEEARARMEHLVIRRPLDAQVRRACGLTYEALGEQKLAAACFARADELEQGEFATAAPIKPAELEVIEPAAAVEVLDAEVATPSIDSEAPLSRADDSEGTGAEVGAVRQAHAFEPVGAPILTADGHLQYGIAHLQAGQADEARKELKAAIEAAEGDSRPALEGAMQSLKHAQPELAFDLANQGTHKFPRSAGLYRLQGTAAYQLGRHREAEAALRQSLSLDNSQGLTYFLLGSVLDRLGKTESAQWHLSQAARLDRRFAARK